MHELVEDPFKVGKGIVAVVPHLFDKGVDHRTPPASLLSTNKHPILRAQLRRADGVFGEIVVPLNPPILKAGFKVGPLVGGVFEGLTQGALGKDATMFGEMAEEFFEVAVGPTKKDLACPLSNVRPSPAVFEPGFNSVDRKRPKIGHAVCA